MMAEVREVGTVTEIKRGVVKLSGMPSCVMGQLVALTRETKGLVVGFTDLEVLALVLGDETCLSVGQIVEASPEPLRVPAGPALLGRVVSALGEPRDGGAALAASETEPLFRDAPGILARTPVVRQLATGVRVIDAMIPLGRGQRELLIGDRMTGKTSLALDAILNQQDQGLVCVYAAIGQSHQKLRQVTQLLRERGALAYTIVVAATASAEASEQFLAPYAACAIGESFMRAGRDVLVVFDDLSKHAWAHRQLSLLMELPPGREAYPGDMFYVHAQLMERAGQLGPEQGGGSMTFLPICETTQGDVTGYICSNLISMTDGQLYLSSELFYEGIKPAVDVGLSVSRIGNKVQPPLLRAVAGGLRLELLQHQELLRLTRFAASASEDLAERRRHGELLRRLMRQAAHEPMSAHDQALLFFAFQAGWLERITEAGLARCLTGLATHLPAFAREVLERNEPMTPTAKSKLDAGLDVALREFVRTEETHGTLPQTVA